jgi:hypothetical protein
VLVQQAQQYEHNVGGLDTDNRFCWAIADFRRQRAWGHVR